MTYLLDTNVLSETRKRQPARGVTRSLNKLPARKLVSDLRVAADALRS
jgi:predicted nucleic acid-binding protein